MSPEQFLFREARLMDEMRYDEWFALWLDTGIYWVPVNPDDSDPRRQVSIIYDDYLQLQQRVDRLKSGSVLALEQAKGAMRRIISNIEVSNSDAPRVTVESNFLLGVARTAEQQIWMGRTIHELVRHEDGFRIAAKKVLLINSAREMPLLQFLI